MIVPAMSPVPDRRLRTRHIALVNRYFDLMEAGEAGAATAMLHPSAQLLYPGGRRYDSVERRATDARLNYRWIRKHRAVWDFSLSDADSYVVVSSGTLEGVLLDGSTFSGVRYIDRFAIRDGMITSHEVWNDLAASGIFEETQSR